jgi:hypothetical protein
MRRLPLAALLLAALLPGLARADAPEFIARVDRNQLALGESFILEVTFAGEDARGVGYHPPELRGMRVVSEQPSQSTQVQILGGNSSVRTVLTWRYEVEPLQKGILTIGPARIQVGSREMRTTAMTLSVGDPAPAGRPAAPPANARRGVSPLTGFPFSSEPAEEGHNFIRVVPSKIKAYVGEQISVEWFLYFTSRVDNYAPVTEPRVDGFWSEELPSATGQNLPVSRQVFEGQEYQVAPLRRRALFGLQPGRLTITPMEAEISQVDFFGSTMRAQRLKTDPMTIEVLPLPVAGQPRGFDPAAVGRFQLGAEVDRDKVSVGEAVTLTVTINGRGNIRKLPAPTLGRLEGWKLYDPKINVTIDPGDVVSGRKTVEYLLLPERPGNTVIPAFTLPFFDPSTKSYVVEKTAPLHLRVVGEAAGPSTPGRPQASTSSGAENLLGLDIRPLRVRASLRRDLGGTLYRSRGFAVMLAAPPLAFVMTALVGRIRGRLSQDTEGARRRRLRRLVRRRLGAAERHLRDGEAGPFFGEIDRVLREFLTGKLGRPVAGLSRDELRAHLAAAGLGAELVDRTIAALEECDRARFSPGRLDETEMRAALDRAGEVILQIERSRLREVAA